MRNSIVLAAGVALLGACAEPVKLDKPRSEMSQRERDSTIAASRLPGAGVVKKGMHMAEREAKRAALIDSLAEN